MKVGDLVRIKYDGVVALVVRIEDGAAGHPRYGARSWVHLLDQPVPFRADKLEVVNESR